MNLQDFSAAVVRELDEMRKAGMRVPRAAIRAAMDPAAVAVAEFFDSSMSVGDAAELLVELN